MLLTDTARHGEPLSRWLWLALIVVMALGLHLRLQAVMHTRIDTPVRADAADYLAYAENLKHHGVYSRARSTPDDPDVAPDALRSPGYPALLTTLLDDSLDGPDQLLRFYLVQALLSALTIILVFQLARSIVAPVAALSCAALTALSPHLINMNSYVLSETLFALLIGAAALCMARTANSRSMMGLFLLGMLFAAGALTRPWLQYFPFLFAAWVFVMQRDKGGGARAAALLGGFAVLYLPWLVRNIVAIGATSDPNLMINGLHHGMYPDFRFAGLEQTFGIPYRFDPRSAEISLSVGHILAEIMRRFQDDFLTHLRWFLLGNPLTLFSWSTIQGVGEIFIYPPLRSPYFSEPLFRFTAAVMKALHAPLMFLSVVGVAFTVRQPNMPDSHQLFVLRALALLMMYFVAIHIVVAPFPRYSIPLRPLSYLFAVFAISVIVDSLSARLRGTPPT